MLVDLNCNTRVESSAVSSDQIVHASSISVVSAVALVAVHAARHSALSKDVNLNTVASARTARRVLVNVNLNFLKKKQKVSISVEQKTPSTKKRATYINISNLGDEVASADVSSVALSVQTGGSDVDLRSGSQGLARASLPRNAAQSDGLVANAIVSLLSGSVGIELLLAQHIDAHARAQQANVVHGDEAAHVHFILAQNGASVRLQISLARSADASKRLV